MLCFNDSTSWGWATWKDRWDTIDWELEPFGNYRKYKSAFNKWLGSDAWRMLKDGIKVRLNHGLSDLTLPSLCKTDQQ